MLKPDKHTNPTLSVINIAALIIAETRKNEIIGYTDLLNALIKQTSASVKEVYNYALSFLYLLDKIEYLPELDALQLKNIPTKG